MARRSGSCTRPSNVGEDSEHRLLQWLKLIINVHGSIPLPPPTAVSNPLSYLRLHIMIYIIILTGKLRLYNRNLRSQSVFKIQSLFHLGSKTLIMKRTLTRRCEDLKTRDKCNKTFFAFTYLQYHKCLLPKAQKIVEFFPMSF